jgi:hypothetical protein
MGLGLQNALMHAYIRVCFHVTNHVTCDLLHLCVALIEMIYIDRPIRTPSKEVKVILVLGKAYLV